MQSHVSIINNKAYYAQAFLIFNKTKILLNIHQRLNKFLDD